MTYEEAKKLVNTIEELEEVLKGVDKMKFLITPDIFGLDENSEKAGLAKQTFDNMTDKVEARIEMLKLGFDGI